MRYVLLLLTTGLIASAAGKSDAPGQVTFNRDVLPILQKSCRGAIDRVKPLRCHSSRTRRRVPGRKPSASRYVSGRCRHGSPTRMSANSRMIVHSARRKSRLSQSGPTPGRPKGIRAMLLLQ